MHARTSPTSFRGIGPAGRAALLLVLVALGPAAGHGAAAQGAATQGAAASASPAAPAVGSTGGTAAATGTKRVFQSPSTVSANPWPEQSPSGFVQLPHDLTGYFIGPDGGWIAKFLPGPTSDPLLEVYLLPPVSGHPSKVERFTLQVPAAPWLAPREERALVIGFHPFGLSEKSVINASGLPQICEQRGWYLLAPYGLIDTNFANKASQDAVDAILVWLRQYLDFDRDRVYTVGFSMGGVNALSYALRHQDPDGLVRVAGVVHHTGTVDPVAQYLVGNLATKLVMSQPDVFGGSPSEEPFAWDRVNPLRVIGGSADATKAQVANLKDLRFYLHWNSQDTEQHLIPWNRALRDYLLSQGAEVEVNEVQAGPVHAWSTLSMTTAIDYLAGSTAPAPGELGDGTAEFFVDRVATYRCTEVRAIEPQTVGRYRLSLAGGGGNALAVQGARGVRRLAVDLDALPVTPSLPLSVTSWTTDGKPITLVLKGYTTAPSQVLVGGAPPLALSHDAAAGELTITPNASGAFAVIDIVP